MKLEPLITPERMLVLDGVAHRDELLGKLADHIAHSVPEIDATALEAALSLREGQGPTSTPEGVAFPHAMYEGAPNTFVSAALLKTGVNFGNDAHPVSDLVFVLVGAPDSAWQHVSVLARLARICHAPGALDRMRNAGTPEQLHTKICEEDARHG